MAESQRKFKEGDKVRVIKKSSYYIGREGVISYIRYNSFRDKTVYTIKMDGSEEDFYSYELEKIDEIEQPKKEEHKLSFEEGQIVILLDGKKYEICRGTSYGANCSMCNLSIYNSKDRKSHCETSYVDNYTTCPLSNRYYFKLIEDSSKDAKSVVSENKEIKLPLELGQIVTLLDGKEYKVCENLCNQRCVDCSLSRSKGSNCKICYIQGVSYCHQLFPKNSNYYFELVEQPSSPIVHATPKKKEYCNFVKVTFTMTDFQPDHIGHHKRTII